MKRRIVIIVLLLIGGEVVNVAVAWGFILRARTLSADRSYRYLAVELTAPLTARDKAWLERAGWRDVPLGTQDHQPALFSVLRETAMERRSFDIHPVSSFELGFVEYRRGGPSDLYCLRAGWPLLALEGGIRCRADLLTRMVGSTDQRKQFESVTLIPFDVPAGSIAMGLPLRPILPGFIVNTLVYALLLWLLFFAPFAARRMLRRRRGLCEKCAYPIGVSDVCTECGAAVSRRVESAT